MGSPLDLLTKNFRLTDIHTQPYIFTLAFLTLFIPLIYSPLLANGAELPRYAFISLFALLSTLLFFSSFYKNPSLAFNQVFLIPLFIFIWSCLSLLWSLDVGNSFIELPHFLSYLLILFIAMQMRQYQQQNLVINLAIISCFLVTLIGILQTLDLDPFNIHYPGLPASTFINPNHASMFIEFFIPVLFFLMLYKNNPRTKALYSLVLVFALSFLTVLSSFGTFLSIIFSLLIAIYILIKQANFYSTLKNNKRYLATTLIGTSFLILILSFFSSTALQKEKSLSLVLQKHTHTQRLALYVNSMEAIIDNPLAGFGYGAFRTGILPYISDVQSITKHSEHHYYQETHNDFIQQFTETGIISGIVFISFFAYILYLGLSSLKNKTLSDKNIFIFSITSGLLVLILHAFIDFPFHLSASSLLIYLSAGFILSTTAKQIIFNKSMKVKIAVTSICIILLSVIFISVKNNLNHIYSNKLIRDTAIAFRKEKNCSKAVALIDKSNQLFEFDLQSQSSQTQIYGVCPQTLKKQKQVINKLVNLNPTNFRARFLRGNIALFENNLNAAFKDYYYISELLPQSALGYIGLSQWALKSQKYTEARIFAEKARDINPKSYEVKVIFKQIEQANSLFRKN